MKFAICAACSPPIRSDLVKKFPPGLSDSIASLAGDTPPCPCCDSSSQIADGLCVGCLLEAGLRPAEEAESEKLEDLLGEVKLSDQNWRLGNYEVLEEIGRGGMGVIYRARQRHSRRIVALKRVLSYHSDSRETLGRFRREAQAAASLDHPNILPIYEVTESEDGLPFFSMKFAPGGTLQQVGPALRNDPRQCVVLVAKVARAVEYAHGNGILHRDLKPGNILLDGRGEPLVADFGLAKWLDSTSEFTRSLTIFGTPGYIAPEQAHSPATELKPTADIYSLGAILFDLLAGRPPFLGAHALSVIRQASESEAPRLRSLSKTADRDLETICARCLERDAAARYHSARELAEDLERWLDGRSVVARPVSPAVRVWRWSRRNPKLAIAFSAIVALLGAAVIERIRTQKLARIVRQAEIAQHSIVVAPFEDLDTLSATSEHALSASNAFRQALAQTSGVYLRSLPGKPDEVLHLSTAADWKKFGETSAARMILSGTTRSRQGKQHVGLHLIETTSGSIVKTWFDEGITFSDNARASAGKIVEALDGSGPDVSTKNGEGGTDPTSASSAASRRYCSQGKELMFRYSLADLDRAIDCFRKATQIDPGNAEAHAMLASACQARAQTDPDAKSLLLEADAALDTALRIAPLLPEAYRAKAGILRRRGDLLDSLDPFLTAYELDPADLRTLVQLGDVHEQIGRPDLALGWLEKALRVQSRPYYADVIGNAWAALGNYDEAEKAYNNAIIFQPDLPVGMLGLSRIALVRGDYESARDKCSLAKAQSKSNPQPEMMAALIEFFGRNFGEAEKLYEQRLKSDRVGGVDFAGSVRYLSALGYLKSRANRTEEGRALLEEARQLDQKELAAVPNNSRRLYSLAATHAALGNEAEAERTLDQAIAAGWIDYRSMMIDPRFDPIRNEAAFQEKLTRLTLRVQDMRRPELNRTLASKLN
jgi:serine/threonine protein kinase/Tfp pilus assembly protein PilF